MPYWIRPSDDGNYIIMKEVGDFTREIAAEHTVEAHALGVELGIRCYLVDMSESRNIESSAANYRYAHSDIQQIPTFDRTACVAVLVDAEDGSHDFYEVAAINAGLDLKLFTDRETAVQHLLDGADRLRGTPPNS